MSAKILIADGDRQFGENLKNTLKNNGFNCDYTPDGVEALDRLVNDEYGLLLTELTLSSYDGLELLEKVSRQSSRTLVIIMTASASLESAIAALRKGAIDYLVKPFSLEDLLQKIKKISKIQQSFFENRYLRKEIHTDFFLETIIGESPAMRNIFNLIAKVANSSSNILITGKSGTGKDLIARAIHQGSPRANAPFIPINCGAIPDTLFESELFGFKKGSFTGATMDKDGVFRAANGGTLFLDEVGEIPIHTQVKLLRAIETKEIKPLGSSTAMQVDVRVLSATNKDLRKEIEEGNFREDLYYRLNIIEIHLPSLSERREDIPLLIEHFIRKYNQILKRKVLGVDKETLKILINYKWKGEVRELENIIERAVLLCEGDYISPKDLPPHTQEDIVPDYSDDLKTSVKNFERQHILDILRRVDGDKNKCAEILGIGLSSLYRKIYELGIDL